MIDLANAYIHANRDDAALAMIEKAFQRAEKLAGTPRHMLRQPGEHIAADGKLAPLGPVLKKRQPAGSTKRLQSNDQSARQPAHKARGQVREPCGPDVRREDHLPPAGQEIVNRLHERLNDRGLIRAAPGQVLQVLNHEQIS